MFLFFSFLSFFFCLFHVSIFVSLLTKGNRISLCLFYLIPYRLHNATDLLLRWFRLIIFDTFFFWFPRFFFPPWITATTRTSRYRRVLPRFTGFFFFFLSRIIMRRSVWWWVPTRLVLIQASCLRKRPWNSEKKYFVRNAARFGWHFKAVHFRRFDGARTTRSARQSNTTRQFSSSFQSFFFSFLRPFFYWGQRFFYWRLIGRNFFVDAVLVLFVCLFFHELERVSRFTGSVRVPFPGRDIHLFRFYDVIMVSCRFYWIFKKVSDG